MKPFAWLALILLFTPCLARAQDAAAATDAPDKQTDYNKIVDHFFEMVQAGQYTAAAHVLIDTNSQDSLNVEKHESLAVPLKKIADNFGAFKGFKPIVTKSLGDGVGYVYGLAVYERSPIRFEFMFYKDGADWRLLHIDFNLNYVPELRDLAGVHIQPQPVYAPAPPPQTPAPAAKPSPPANPEPPATPPASSTTPPASAPAPDNPHATTPAQ